jgi:hypothetical protein
MTNPQRIQDAAMHAEGRLSLRERHVEWSTAETQENGEACEVTRHRGVESQRVSADVEAGEAALRSGP